MNKRIIYLILISVFALGCLGKKYGHYRYSKKQKTKTAKINKHTKKGVVTLPLKNGK